MSGFQKKINIYPAMGVAGDFASTNQHFSLVAGEGQLKAAEGGVIIGRFAFADLKTGLVSNKHADGTRVGFVNRAQNLASLGYMQGSSMTIPQGREVTLITGADFIVELEAGNPNDKIVASKVDGSIKAVEDASNETDYIDTGYILATVPANGLAKITKLG